MKRKEGGRGLISVDDCVRLEEKGLFEYVNGSEEWMIYEVVGIPWVEQAESRDDYESGGREKAELGEKVLHGRFFREDVAVGELWIYGEEYGEVYIFRS